MIKAFLNPEGHKNPISGSKVTAILLKRWIWPIGGVASGRVCACSLNSRLVSKGCSKLQSKTIIFYGQQLQSPTEIFDDPKLQSPTVILVGPKLWSPTIILDGQKIWSQTFISNGPKLRSTTVTVDHRQFGRLSFVNLDGPNYAIWTEDPSSIYI